MSTKAKESSLRSNQQKALEALLSGMTKQQAAAAAGVQPSTLSRWLTEEAFKAALREGSEEALEHATMRLRAMVDTAASVFLFAMLDKKTSTPVRLRAADMVMTHALKLLEFTELVERIAALEEKIR